jgi:spore coat protein CotF
MKTPVKFGAHEVMEASEILTEKMNLINHLALYEQEAQDEQLRSMIRRHMDTAISAYDQMVAYTHDFSARHGMSQPYPQPDADLERLKYGLRNPQPIAPQRTGRFNDMMIQSAMLILHKASAISHTQRGMEMTDPNVRQMCLNGAITCYNQAYETFLLMNQQGSYQVPTIHDHTAKTVLHAYQPIHAQPGIMQDEMGAMGAMGARASMGQMNNQMMQQGPSGRGQSMSGMTPNPMNMPQMNGHYVNQ